MDQCISSKNESLCRVCGDKASGKHYGVSSCDGCRGFFKRSIRRNLEYVCKENGSCIVDVTRRNQCQACRFKKCLQVNMKRDAVQHERAPRSSQSSLNHYPLNFSTRVRALHGSIFTTPIHPPLLEPSYLTQNYFYPTNMLGTIPKNVGFMTNLPSSTPSPSYLNKQPTIPILISRCKNAKDDEVTSSEELLRENSNNKIEDSGDDVKKRLELPLLATGSDGCKASPTASRPTDISCLTLFSLENVYESAAKLLFLAIKWARSIPSFLQLSFRDQLILLEESWSDLFVLTAAQWTFPVDEVNNALTLHMSQTNLEENAHKLKEVISRLTLLRVDHTEHACLKALVLFKSECRGLCEAGHVELLQDQTHVMLSEYCNQRQNIQKGRFGKLLLTLPAVQSISRKSLEELIFRQTIGEVSIEKFLNDISKLQPH